MRCWTVSRVSTCLRICRRNRRHLLEEQLPPRSKKRGRQAQAATSAIGSLARHRSFQAGERHPRSRGRRPSPSDPFFANGPRRSCGRWKSVLGRWGGEEFLVLLPYASADGAMIVAERIRQGASSAPVVLDGGATDRPTVSIGCACTLPRSDAPLSRESRCRAFLPSRQRLSGAIEWSSPIPTTLRVRPGVARPRPRPINVAFPSNHRRKIGRQAVGRDRKPLPELRRRVVQYASWSRMRESATGVIPAPTRCKGSRVDWWGCGYRSSRRWLIG